MEYKLVVKVVNTEDDLKNTYSPTVWWVGGFFLNMKEYTGNFAILQNESVGNFNFHFIYQCRFFFTTTHRLECPSSDICDHQSTKD